jgi:3-oxoacyl-(acyl-carrier-protein) synthase
MASAMAEEGSRFPVVTGIGIVAAPGYGIEEVWRAIEASQCGLRPMSLFESPRYGPVLAAEVRRDLKELGAPLRGSRGDRLAWLAARQAIESSKIDLPGYAERTGVLLGASVGGSFDCERFLTALIKRQKMLARPARFHECDSAVQIIAENFGLYGPSMAVATACSSGALAIATAADLIMTGEADVMLAGGADSLSRMTWGGFHSLLLVDGAGCRPFDANRAGMSLGEGAAVLVIEAEETARNRGATILARLSGWGASCDAHHATAPHPQGAGAAAAMQSALRRAGLEPRAIDYVNAHGTGTRDNDIAEANALKSIFGERVPPVSSTKRFFGHSLAASGAIEAAVCIEALRRGQMPPNIGFTTLDPAIGIEPVKIITRASLTHVMSNSFGFGGNNAVLIFSQPQSPALTRSIRTKPVAVTGVGAIGPGVVVNRQIEPPLPAETLPAHSCGTLAGAEALSPNQRRRLNRLVQMALIATRRSHSTNAAQRIAIAMGTGMGCLEEGAVFIENLISKDEREPMPARFPGSVHNAPAAQIAIDQQARGLNSAPTMGEISFECALWQAMNQLWADEADSSVAGAVDELNKYLLSIGKRWGQWTEQTRPGEGAVAVSLSLPENAQAPLAKVTAVHLGRYRRPFDAKREVDWISSKIDLQTIDVVMSGAKGLTDLEPMYEAVITRLKERAGKTIEHQTYKQLCGEFHSASAFGFSRAVDLVRQGKRAVLLYTLSLRGGKAMTVIQAVQSF